MLDGLKRWILVDYKQNQFWVLIRDRRSDHDRGLAMYGVLNKLDDFRQACLYAAGVIDGQKTMFGGEYETATLPEEITLTPEARARVEEEAQ
jgi:hypothetical protein